MQKYFNGKLYEQIDGVAIGLPLGPLLANVFMFDFKEKFINNILKTTMLMIFFACLTHAMMLNPF